MSVATIVPALVSQRSSGRPFASPETLARAVIVTDGDGSEMRHEYDHHDRTRSGGGKYDGPIEEQVA